MTIANSSKIKNKTMNNPVIIIEGPDFSGKSTLANTLMKKYRNHAYIHCAVTPNIYALHTTALKNAETMSSEFTVIIDRLHYSELIYAPIFRNGASYDVRAFDAALSDYQNIYKILCLPPKDIVLEGFKKRAAQGGEMFDTVERVYDAYAANPLGWSIYDWTKGSELALEDYKA